MTNLQSTMQLLTSQELNPTSVLARAKISPLLKWPGGKTGELSLILPELPPDIDRYFEPFLGGGAVFLSIADHIPAFVNDTSTDLIQLYRCVCEARFDFFMALEDITNTWRMLEEFIVQHKNTILEIYGKYTKNELSAKDLANDISLVIRSNEEHLKSILGGVFGFGYKNFISEVSRNITNKIIRTYNIENEYGEFSSDEILLNMESAVKSGYYMYIREIYNHCDTYDISADHRAAIFFFMREYAYASMFRFNSKGHFNVPYGGISYNRKDLSGKIELMKQQSLIDRLVSAQ